MDLEKNQNQNSRNENLPEIGTRLHMTVSQVAGSSECVFVGKSPEKCLVVTVPASVSPMEASFLKGKTITIRYVTQGRLVTFDTLFIRLVFEPTALMLLAQPESVETRDQRCHKRVNCFMSADVEMETENQEKITGVIKDISKSGCCFLYQAKSDGLFQINEPITIWCRFPGIAGEQQALGKVIDIQVRESETTVRIQFLEDMWWVPPYS